MVRNSEMVNCYPGGRAVSNPPGLAPMLWFSVVGLDGKVVGRMLRKSKSLAKDPPSIQQPVPKPFVCACQYIISLIGTKKLLYCDGTSKQIGQIPRVYRDANYVKTNIEMDSKELCINPFDVQITVLLKATTTSTSGQTSKHQASMSTSLSAISSLYANSTTLASSSPSANSRNEDTHTIMHNINTKHQTMNTKLNPYAQVFVPKNQQMTITNTPTTKTS